MEPYLQSSSEIKRALKQTVSLDDGRLGYIFTEIGYQGSDPRWLCHICCRTIISERAMSMHIGHPLHNRKLLLPAHPSSQFKKFTSGKGESGSFIEDTSSGDEKFDKSPLNVEPVMDVVPGEPVPPGMEDIVEGVCQIQTTIDGYKDGPLIGLEYIVELVSTEGNSEPRYICLLCEKKGDPRSVMVHVTSQNHYLKYISCFFRTAGNALNMITRNNDNRKGINIAITKVAAEIEKHYGRLKPMSAEAETFLSKKYEILRLIDEKQHFRESPSTTFAELVTIEKINEYNNTPESCTDDSAKQVAIKKEDVYSKEKQGSYQNSKNNSQNGQNRSKMPVNKSETKFNETPRKKDESRRPKTNGDEDDVIIIGDEKSNSAIEIGSLPSISPISSSSSHRRSRSGSRFNSRSRPQPKTWSRARSRNRRPRYRSRSRSRNRRPKRRSRSREYFRRSSPRSYRRHSPQLPYKRNRKSYSRSRSRSLDRRLGEPRDPVRNHRTIPYHSYRPDHKSYDNRYYHHIEEPERGQERWGHLPRHEEHQSIYRSEYEAAARRYKEMKKEEEEKLKKMKWEEFNGEIEKLEVEMNERLKYYQSHPEKHPMYPEEWKCFWNRRYKELQLAGQDASQYDFKPEWIIFWDKRMKEMHEQEFASKKEELRLKLSTDQWIGKRSLSDDLQDISPPTPEPPKDVTVDDIKNTWKALTGSDITAPSAKRSPSPWEYSSSPPPRTDSTMVAPVVATSFPNPSYSTKVSLQRDTGRKFYESVPPIIHCLRMLSVLENQLGSLGPKVLELLSKSLVLEKTKTSASMTLLQNRDIYIMFETVKEKLRGQLLAGVVMRHLVGPTRAVIKAIDSMLTTNPLKPEVFEPVKVPGVGMVDKVAVAQQIASALVAQGKTDVSQQELEELINAVVGMAKASNATTTAGMSSAAFFSQLNIINSTGSTHINQILTNMITSAQKSMGMTTNEPPSIVTKSVEPLSQIHKLVPQSTLPTRAQAMTPPYNMTFATSDQPNKVSDLELKEALIKFKNLPRDEQYRLISLLKELESTQPERVEKLRDYVTVSLYQEQPKLEVKLSQGRLSPFSMRSGGANPSPEIKSEGYSNKNKRVGDSEEDDDDYSYEDVYKAASENLRINEIQEKNKQLQAGNFYEDSVKLPQADPCPINQGVNVINTYTSVNDPSTAYPYTTQSEAHSLISSQLNDEPLQPPETVYSNYINEDRINYPPKHLQGVPPSSCPNFTSLPQNNFNPTYNINNEQHLQYMLPEYNPYQSHYSQY